jgi:hypothetical protein
VRPPGCPSREDRDLHACPRRVERVLTLLNDGERLTGATLAIRVRVPLEVLRDAIQPFPTFSEIFLGAVKALHAEIARARRPARAAAG